METIILKIGGSVITEKDKDEFKVKEDSIIRLAREIKSAKDNKEFRLVFIHGAGPFGHKMVSDYRINNGLDVEKGIEGFVRTHNSMEDLDYIIMDCFREEGLLGFPVHPSSVIVQDRKKIVSFNTETVSGLLELSPEIVPIMHGDMVLDKRLKGSVVSGDALVSYLAKSLNADKIFLGTDVDGIYTDDPKKNPSAELIDEINNGNFEKVFSGVKEASTTDVTSGMKGKLEKIRDSVRGIEVVIFNANKDGNLLDALSGKEITGTRIDFE